MSGDRKQEKWDKKVFFLIPVLFVITLILSAGCVTTTPAPDLNHSLPVPTSPVPIQTPDPTLPRLNWSILPDLVKGCNFMVETEHDTYHVGERIPFRFYNRGTEEVRLPDLIEVMFWILEDTSWRRLGGSPFSSRTLQPADSIDWPAWDTGIPGGGYILEVGPEIPYQIYPGQYQIRTSGYCKGQLLMVWKEVTLTDSGMSGSDTPSLYRNACNPRLLVTRDEYQSGESVEIVVVNKGNVTMSVAYPWIGYRFATTGIVLMTGLPLENEWQTLKPGESATWVWDTGHPSTNGTAGKLQSGLYTIFVYSSCEIPYTFEKWNVTFTQVRNIFKDIRIIDPDVLESNGSCNCTAGTAI